MNDRLQVLIDSEKTWLLDRPAMQRNNKDPERIAHNLHNESLELMDAISAFCLGQVNIKEIGQEVADVFKFLLNLCLIFDLDLFGEVMEKHAYNMCRFTAITFGEDADYDTAYKGQKTVVKRDNMKGHFYGEQGVG